MKDILKELKKNDKTDLLWICKEIGIKCNKKDNKIQIINQILKPLNNRKYRMGNIDYMDIDEEDINNLTNWDNFNLDDLDDLGEEDYLTNWENLNLDGYSSSESFIPIEEEQNSSPEKKQKNRSSKRRRKNVITFIYTKSATGDTYNKAADSKSQLKILRDRAEDILLRENVVGISMVIPDGRYLKKDKNKPHEGHTFALSRNDEYLVVYDTHENEYLNGPVFWNSYRELIDYLAEKYNGEYRKIIFFPIVKNIWEKFKCDSEGSCQSYTRTLEEEEIIKKPKDAIQYLEHSNINYNIINKND